MTRGPIRVLLLNQQTADETTSIGVDVQGFPNLTFYLIGYGTLDAGAVTFEESVTDPAHGYETYGGTWSIIGSAVNANDVTGGKQKATRATVGAYAQVRARINTAVTGAGGSISVVLVACQ
jgi:hypothetical protein